MFVILEATAGPAVGRKVQVPAKSIVRVGRTAQADYVLREDSYLSGQHLALEYDGAECTIRDLGSSNGTFVNGERIADCRLHEGDSVGAGGSTFVVHFDSSAAPETSRIAAPTLQFASAGSGLPSAGSIPVRGEPPRVPGFSRAQSLLLHAIYREGQPVYAVLDTVKDARIATFMDASGEKYARVDEKDPLSPLLVLVPQYSRLLDVLIKDGWNQNWGFYFSASVEFEDALRHWRSLIPLQNRFGQTVTLHFWDPRVLRVVLAAATPCEAAVLFGPISCFVMESDIPGRALEFTREPSGVHQQALALLAS